MAFLWFITVRDGDTGTAIIRMCSDTVPQTSNGQAFIAYPQMRVTLPAEQEDRTPRVSITLEDVDQTIEAALRNLNPTDPPTVDIELIASDELNTVQVGVYGLHIVSAEGDGTSIECELGSDNLIALRSPGCFFLPSVSPGLFGG